MKAFIVLIFSLSYTVAAFGQESTILPNKKDTLSSADFTINGYYLDDSLSFESFKKLKSRTDSVKYDTGRTYANSEIGLYFKKSVLRFYYKSTRISSFEMYDNSFAFVVKGIRIQIGDDDAPLKHLFPITYSEKYQSDIDKKDTWVVVNITDYDGILFILRSNKIKGIEYFFDNE